VKRNLIFFTNELLVSFIGSGFLFRKRNYNGRKTVSEKTRGVLASNLGGSIFSIDEKNNF